MSAADDDGNLKLQREHIKSFINHKSAQAAVFSASFSIAKQLSDGFLTR
ncbi:hypothetical protein RJJ65_21280 [Rhizobium hidalgonense]|uniref:Uncharacterized protein n=1 Tax=Rhizobium hidalgonense TaxID=1538159 RepID=A0AAJ2GXE3_9HYPH|nr:hypothetical protein [Rhizobium hidalgonense]MDR9775137.1 hypothetical protein [Rhizobium hidalgonense]